jgi:acetyl-CoA carboxylase carboxyltransferase component
MTPTPTILDGRALYFQIMAPIEPDLANIPNLSPEDAAAIFSREEGETEEAFAARNAHYDEALAEYDRQYRAYMRAKEQEVQQFASTVEQRTREQEAAVLNFSPLAA